jgi:hypothetical protein
MTIFKNLSNSPLVLLGSSQCDSYEQRATDGHRVLNEGSGAVATKGTRKPRAGGTSSESADDCANHSCHESSDQRPAFGSDRGAGERARHDPGSELDRHRAVRRGGELIVTSSARASSVRIQRAQTLPRNASQVPLRSSQPRCAAQHTIAGAAMERNPATIPISNASR